MSDTELDITIEQISDIYLNWMELTFRRLPFIFP